MEIDESSAGNPPWMTAGGPGGSGSAAARRPHSHGMADLIGTGSADRDIDKVTGFVLSHRFFFSSDYWIYFSCSMVSVAQSSFFFVCFPMLNFVGGVKRLQAMKIVVFVSLTNSRIFLSMSMDLLLV